MAHTNLDESTVTPTNIVMNAPVWRKSLHDRVGYFLESGDTFAQRSQSEESLSCDYEFWVRAKLAGLKFLHNEYPLDIYTFTQKRQSMSHRPCTGPCYSRPESTKKLRYLGLYNNRLSIQNLAYKGVIPSSIPTPTSSKVLVVTELWPTTTEGNDRRLRQLISFLIDNGHRVTFAARVRDSRTASTAAWLRQQKVTVQTLGKTIAILKQENRAYDIVYVHAWFWYENWAGPFLTDIILPHSPFSIVLTDDIHYRKCDTVPQCKGKKSIVRAAEVRAYSAADLLVAITEEDLRMIKSFAAVKTGIVLPYTVIPQWTLSTRTPFQQRKYVTFIDSDHSGSRLALRWLLQSVWPLVMKDSLAQECTLLLLGGRNAESNWGTEIELARKVSTYSMGVYDQVVDGGFVDNLEEKMGLSRVMTFPSIQAGSGVTTKTFLGYEWSVPVVTTPAAAVGLPFNPKPLKSGVQEVGGVLVAKEPQPFADALIMLLTDETAWTNHRQQLQDNTIHVSKFAWLEKEEFLKPLLLRHDAK